MVIDLRHIVNVKRSCRIVHCLLLETKDRRFHLFFKNGEELNGWKKDIYSSSVLVNSGNPAYLNRQVHVSDGSAISAFTVNPVHCDLLTRLYHRVCTRQCNRSTTWGSPASHTSPVPALLTVKANPCPVKPANFLHNPWWERGVSPSG